ncbi:hypothetical protein EJB05_54401 [Eragrostis curvula]|uniref:Uncharacterized protein n=1 Tax=Eragrostis curvula TaxID=38414 RepID=A0A5J9SMG9_9POAL|nr:hypothetical protein EJB05_54401 [Eragrostis curvula]
MRRRDAARCSSTSASKKRILIRSSSTPATNGDSSVVRSSEELHQMTGMRQLVRAEAAARTWPRLLASGEAAA